MSPRLARRCCWFRTLFPRETLVYIFWHKGGQTFWACKSNLVLKTRGHDQKSDFKSQFWKASNEKISPGVGEVFFNIIKLVLDIYLFRVLIGLWQRKIMNRVLKPIAISQGPAVRQVGATSSARFDYLVKTRLNRVVDRSVRNVDSWTRLRLIHPRRWKIKC